MQDGGQSMVHVAPLHIPKSQRDLEATTTITTTILTASDQGLQYDKELPEEPFSPRARFQNFLRASYPFQPQDKFSSTSVTIPLTAGDIVLVHSIHTNGWADGTLLETGARGWLPTNYCEPYDYATMRPLLKALTEFWDIMRSDGDTDADLYRNHDYMRGMVAGVRFLLEKSDCLTRDAPLVKQDENIRKTRKGLLADLSVLVKAAKQVQTYGAIPAQIDDPSLDDMLLKAFQVVTRAVSFFDIWSEGAALVRSSPTLGRTASYSPEPQTSSDTSTVHGTFASNASKRTSLYGSQLLMTTGPTVQRFSRPRPASISRPPTVTHRMSYTSRGLQARQSNLASEQLSDTYDAFLGVLASFLGSHMQSRSSSELLLTTQQAVKSCRKLLEIIEIILEHDISTADELQQAKDVMYDKITALVHAAREVFRPLNSDDDDMIYLPGEGARLVNAATACVSGAGRCVAKARVLLEDVGDFELELRTELSDVHTSFGTGTFLPIKTPFESMFEAPESTNSSRPVSLQSPISHELNLQTTKLQHLITAPGSDNTLWTPLTDTTGSPTSTKSAASTELTSDQTLAQVQHQKILARTILNASESTLVSSTRDSGPSFVSQSSTRATSPDSQPRASLKQHDEDRDEGEDAVMEYHYAHEILSSPDGRILGASLNAIIERLTMHDATPDSSFVTMVFLTFRTFATPQEFSEALVFRFDYILQNPHIAHTVRLRVINVFKGWLESHWRHDCDESTIPYIATFVQDKVLAVSLSASNSLKELLKTVMTTHGPAVPRTLSAMGKTNTAGTSNSDLEQPAPVTLLSKSQLTALKMWRMGGTGLSVLDFDPMELARQLTIKTSAIFCSILPEELLGCEFMKQSSSLAVNLRALSQLSTDIGNLVVESILVIDDTKKRAAATKQWIKVAGKCYELHNFETLMTINASLNAASVLRLRKTWDTLGQKTKAMHEKHNEVCSHAKNYAHLRQKFENAPIPCIPYVGIYRTDLIFTDQGNPATRTLETGGESISVVNIDKHMKTAKYISDLQRFQVAYKLTSVDELQTWLQNECVRVRAAGDRDVQNQYRRSLVLEPKFDSQFPQQGHKIKAFASMTSLAGKDKFELFTWAHAPKERINGMDT